MLAADNPNVCSTTPKKNKKDDRERARSLFLTRLGGALNSAGEAPATRRGGASFSPSPLSFFHEKGALKSAREAPTTRRGGASFLQYFWYFFQP